MTSPAYAGQVALITGASRGIGQALAEKTRAEVEQAGGHAITVAADVEQPEEIDKLFGRPRPSTGGWTSSSATRPPARSSRSWS